MMYWIAFALFCVAESFADIFISFWFPFYYEIKILTILWLVSSWTKGATILYRKWIHPTLMKHEEDIDRLLHKVKADVYAQAGTVGRRGLAFAREIVASAALRGQAYLKEDSREQSINRQTIDRDPINRDPIKQEPIYAAEDWSMSSAPSEE